MCSARTGRSVFSRGIGAALGSLGVACVLLGSSACGPSIPTGEHVATRPEPAEQRHAALAELGQRLFDAYRGRRLAGALLASDALAEVLDPVASQRVLARRVAIGTRLGAQSPGAFVGTSFVGICAQGSRELRAGEPPGLLAPAWVVERVLIVAERPGGSRVAAWVEGPFVYTRDGFGVVDLRRVEDPRWEHSDLEIATCDVAFGYRGVAESTSAHKI